MKLVISRGHKTDRVNDNYINIFVYKMNQCSVILVYEVIVSEILINNVLPKHVFFHLHFGNYLCP